MRTARRRWMRPQGARTAVSPLRKPGAAHAQCMAASKNGSVPLLRGRSTIAMLRARKLAKWMQPAALRLMPTARQRLRCPRRVQRSKSGFTRRPRSTTVPGTKASARSSLASTCQNTTPRPVGTVLLAERHVRNPAVADDETVSAMLRCAPDHGPTLPGSTPACGWFRL